MQHFMRHLIRIGGTMRAESLSMKVPKPNSRLRLWCLMTACFAIGAAAIEFMHIWNVNVFVSAFAASVAAFWGMYAVGGWYQRKEVR